MIYTNHRPENRPMSYEGILSVCDFSFHESGYPAFWRREADGVRVIVLNSHFKVIRGEQAVYIPRQDLAGLKLALTETK